MSTTFARDGYWVRRRMIVPPQLHTLGEYHRRLVAGGGMRYGDLQSHRRWVARDEPAARALHVQFMPMMSAVAGALVEPSYTYTTVYDEGAELPKHTDRPECEYSISIAIDFEPTPAGAGATGWPLWLDTAHGPVPVDQALGDGVFFRGRRLAHYRRPLPAGCRSTSVLLHYVKPRSQLGVNADGGARGG